MLILPNTIRSWFATGLGGCTCLQANLLRAIRDYSVQFYKKHGKKVQVQSLAGECETVIVYSPPFDELRVSNHIL